MPGTAGFDVRGACYDGAMKVLSGISAIALFISVGSLESAGPWWAMALVVGACSLAVLFFTCGRMGYFSSAGVRQGSVTGLAR